MIDANLTGLLVDDGYPLPKVDRALMEKFSGISIHRVARIEPMIEAAKKQAKSWEDFGRFFPKPA